jgi:hypothetical protein
MLKITPNPVDFGSGTKEGKTKTIKVTIKNVSSKSSNIDVMVTGENVTGAEFGLKGAQCVKTLKPGKACKVSVTFSPTDIGVEHMGTLTVEDDAMGPQMIPLMGTGK